MRHLSALESKRTGTGRCCICLPRSCLFHLTGTDCDVWLCSLRCYILVEDINLHVIDITHSWIGKDIGDAELGLTGYAMFRRDE